MSASQQRLSASALARRREIARVWNVLHPKPVELRKGRRRFLREGPLKQWSPVQKRVKKKYVFLFSDCLLITRKDNAHRYWMKIFCYLKSIKDIQFVPGQAYAKVPDVEFRIVTPKKTLIFFGASKTETDTWIRDINYARNGCKGRAPPSVWQYGDEDNELDGQEDEIDITGHESEGQIHVGSPHQQQHYPPGHPGAAQQDLPQQDLLVDFLGANAAINPFGGPQGPHDPHGAGFDPFGLGGPVGQQPGQFDPNFLFGMGPMGGAAGQPGGLAGYPGGPGSPGGVGAAGGYPGAGFPGAGVAGQPGIPGYPGAGYPGGDPSAAGFAGVPGGQPGLATVSSPVPRQPAPVFLPDAAQGAAQVASDLVRYLEQMPRDLQNPAIAAATIAAKDASARLQAAIQAFNANPNPETGRQLQQAAAEAALLVSQLMGEATFIAESQPPDDYKRQLAAAVHLTALSLEQLVNASSLALDHYTQQEHMRAIQYQQAQQAAAAAAQAEVEARARAEAEQAAQAAAAAERARLEAEQAAAQKAMLDAAQAEQARIRLQALEAESARLAAQEAQIAEESLASQREAAAALQNSMNSMQAAMESVALSITASAEKLAAAAAAAAAKAEAGEGLPIAGAEIVQGTNSIAGLTAILVRVATEAQMEATRRLGASAIASGQRYHDDPVWREGLISAAQDVGTNIELLVGAAGQAMENNGPLEMLVASLRQVNGATARLVAAARAKMNPESELLPKLGRAAQAVKEASVSLEQTASQAAKQRDAKISAEQQPVPERSATATQSYIDRMEKLAEVARLEKQLEEARKRVAMITKAQYDHM